MEWVTPDLATVPTSAQRKIRAVDINMMQLGNARERDGSDLEGLKHVADLEKYRFEWKGVWKPDGGQLDVSETDWRG